MFMAALFIIARHGSNPRPSTDEWIKMWCICAMEYHSAKNKNETVPSTATETIILSEVNQRKTNVI